MEILSSVNWLAVIVGAVVAFLVGWLWYSPMLFGKKWAAGNGVELGSASSMPVGAMVTQAIGLLLVALFVGVTEALSKQVAVSIALFTFVLAVIAFGVMNASGGLFAKKPTAVVLIDFGYLIVAAIVMFLVQGIL